MQLEFKEVSQNAETGKKDFAVSANSDSPFLIGWIRWVPRSKEYCLFTVRLASYMVTASALKEIVSFIENQKH